MTRSANGRWLPLVAVFAILAACSPAPAASPAASVGSTGVGGTTSATLPPGTGSPAAPPGASAFDVVTSMMGPVGEVSAEMALQAFALAVAPIAGVTPPAGAPGSLDADAAVAWVLQRWNELDPAQQAAIERALAALPDPFADRDPTPAFSSGISLAAWQPATAAAQPMCALTDRAPDAAPIGNPSLVQPYLDQMIEATDAMAGHLGRAALPKLAVCLMPSETLPALALTRVFDAASGRQDLPASCSIFLNADKIGGVDGGDVGYLMAYQTFRCFEATIDPGESLASSSTRVVPAWVAGGSAAWAGATVAVERFGGAGDRLAELWAAYLTEPHQSLFGRTNGAIGFFAQVDQNQPTAWSVLDDALTSPSSVSAFDALTGRRQSFIDLWAAGYFRDASRGPDWDIVGPAIPTDTPEAGSIEIENGGSEEMAAASMAVATADLSTSADITSFASNHLRIHDGTQDLKNVRNQAYCTRDGGSDACACPKGSPGAGRPPLPKLGSEAKLAVTGMEWGATAEIRGLSLEEYCGPEPTPVADPNVWSVILWSPDLGDAYPPLLVAYTCDGLESTWKAIYLPSSNDLTTTFEMPFDKGPVAHLDIHRVIPAAGHSPGLTLDYAVDFELDPTADPPVVTVTGTKTESQGGQTYVLPPREFGSDAPLELRNVSLETQLKPYPQYQHPFRAQALQECGG